MNQGLTSKNMAFEPDTTAFDFGATGQNNCSVQRRVGEVLLDAEIPLGRLNGSMTERNLDLLERGVTAVGELLTVTPLLLKSSMIFSIPCSRESVG